MIEVDVVRSDKADTWNNLVERSPYASAYHLWEWGEALSSTYKHQRYYLATTQNGDVSGILPLIHVKSRLFGNRLISLPFCEHGGPLADPRLKDEETRRVIEGLLDATNNLARALGVEYVEIRNPQASVMQDLHCAQGYSAFQKYTTFKIDLAREQKELWSSLHQRARNKVRKAVKSGVEVEEADGVQRLKDYYKLYLKTQRRHGSPPHGYKLFEKLYDAYQPKGKMKILLAEHQGKPIAGLINFHHNKMIFGWDSVGDAEHRRFHPTNLLLWNTVEWGVKNGYRTFDLGRTRRATTVYRFKSGWGGKETYLKDYVYFVGSNNTEFPDPEQTRYRYLSKLWGLVPTSLSKKIGPKIIGGIAL